MTPRSRRMFVAAVVGLALFVAAFALLFLLVRDGPSTDPSTPLRHEVVRATVAPSSEFLTVEAPGGLALGLPPGALEAPAEVVIATVEGAPPRALPLPHLTLGVWDVRVGAQRRFSEPIFLRLPYDAARLPDGVDAELALTVSYWDDGVGTWLETPSIVDPERGVQIVPTRHLTAFRQDAVIAKGHVYNDYFSIKYDPAELAEMKKRHRNFEDVFDGQPAEVLGALERARAIYAERGFREMERIKAVDWAIAPATATSHERPPWLEGNTILVKNVRYNVYLTGDRHDESWTWKGIMHSSLNRNKFTGDIHVPWDHSGVQSLEIAHEVFHAVQNRYYHLLGMSELGLPGTTSPGATLLARLWWLEATAEYAAGGLAYPRPDGAPHPGMGGDPDLQRLDRALNHSPSVFRPRSERPSYQNAWFLDFLARELDVPFKPLFEEVAAGASPSVLDNLGAALAARGLPLPEVFAGFARWWFLSPRGPILRGCPSCAMPRGALAGAVVKRPGDVLRAWDFPGGAGPHRARLWEVALEDGAPASTGGPARHIIAWLDPRFATSVRVSPPERVVSLTAWRHGERAPEPVSRTLTGDDPFTVFHLNPSDRLYLLAVRNDDLAGVLGAWHPEVFLSEVGLSLAASATPTGAREIVATAARVPPELTGRLRFAWEVDGRAVPPRQGARRKDALDVVTDTWNAEDLAPGPHRIRCTTTLDDGALLAEATLAFDVAEVKAPEAPPEATHGPVFERMTLHPDAGAWAALRGHLETVKGPAKQALEAYTGVPSSDAPAFFSKATLNVTGVIRSDAPARRWTPAEFLEHSRGRWALSGKSPGVVGNLSSGALQIGRMQGAFVLWRHAQKTDSGWGTSWLWELVGVVSAGNASLDVQARVSVDAKRPEDDAAALARFEALVGEADGILRGLKLDLE